MKKLVDFLFWEKSNELVVLFNSTGAMLSYPQRVVNPFALCFSKLLISA